AVLLPTSNSEPNIYFVSGWGTLSENGVQPTRQLRGVNLYLQQRKTCAAAYSGKIQVSENQLCASAPNQDTCHGDSGGALTSQSTQYGIVSYGVDCARPKYPGVYTKVYKYLTWITTVMKSLSRTRN
ncbi:PREDICTED: kallikrein-11-like, partial [Rhagoletis zephyria]|uniref:kallikrein-11-like n=1 Tax=Rhagoletis zephyria TaxID=28612 RepID=UPI000811220D